MIELLICYLVGSCIFGLYGLIKKLFSAEDPRHTESQQFISDYEHRLNSLSVQVDMLREREFDRRNTPTGPAVDMNGLPILHTEKPKKILRNKALMKAGIEQMMEIHIVQ